MIVENLDIANHSNVNLNSSAKGMSVGGNVTIEGNSEATITTKTDIVMNTNLTVTNSTLKATSNAGALKVIDAAAMTGSTATLNLYDGLSIGKALPWWMLRTACWTLRTAPA